jgi:hypothetical protein
LHLTYAESVRKFQPRRVCFETLGSRMPQEILCNSEGSCILGRRIVVPVATLSALRGISRCISKPRVSEQTLGWNLRTLSALRL